MLPPSRIEETALALLSAVLVAVLVLWMTGCAHVDRAQGLDGVTTIIALENGFTEANPLFGGLNGPEIFAVKVAVTQVVKLTPDSVVRMEDSVRPRAEMMPRVIVPAKPKGLPIATT